MVRIISPNSQVGPAGKYRMIIFHQISMDEEWAPERGQDQTTGEGCDAKAWAHRHQIYRITCK